MYDKETGKDTQVSPYELLKQELERSGYVVKYRQLDAGQCGGYTRRSRVIVQAQTIELAEFLKTRVGDREQFMITEGLQETHDIDEDNFIWPKHNKASHSIAPLLDKWHTVPGDYKLPFRRWGEFDRKRDNFDGVLRWGLRPNDNGIGKFTDANRLNSADFGLAPGMTAAGNTGWFVTQQIGKRHRPAIGVRRLQGHECMKIAGFVGRHSIDGPDGELDPDFTESERFEMANNAICVELSRAIFTGVKAYYDTDWFAQHVHTQERSNPQWRPLIAKADWDHHSELKHIEPDSDFDSDSEEEDGCMQQGKENGSKGPTEFKVGIRADTPEEAHQQWDKARIMSRKMIAQRNKDAMDQATIRAEHVVAQYKQRYEKAQSVINRGGQKDDTHDTTHTVELTPPRGDKHVRKVTERNPRATSKDLSECWNLQPNKAWEELRSR
jgi:hypothetical protein